MGSTPGCRNIADHAHPHANGVAGQVSDRDVLRFDQLIQSAREMFPGLKVEGGSRWMGHRPSLPDSLPLIDHAIRFPNVVYAFGHGHMGLSWAPTTGRFVASLVNRQPVNFDLAPFRLARFA